MRHTDSPGIFFPPPLLFVSAVAIGILFDGNLLDRRHVTHSFQAAGVTVGEIGLTLILVSLALFHRHGTRPEPWEASAALIRSGLYRFSRNPMYLGMALTSAGAAIFFESLVAGILLALVVVTVDRFIIAREERYLARRFGEDYEAYRRQVRRWL